MSKEQARKKRREWVFLGVQLVPLIVMMMTVVACGGGGDLGGLGYNISSDVFLSGIFTNSNDSFPDTSYNAFVTNENAFLTFGACAAGLTYPTINAALSIRNGIGVVIEQVAVEFTETNGQALVDLSTPVPISRAGEFDFIINSHISIPANPITSVSTANVEPQGTNTVFAVPVNLGETDIFCNFMRFQPRERPLLAKLTFRGVDVLENRFTLVGFIIFSPLIEIRGT